MIIVETVNNVLTSYIKLGYVCVNIKTNHSRLLILISQSINVEWRTCDRYGKQFFQRKQEKLWLFYKARNILIKNRDMSSEKYTPLDFTKYLSFPEVKRTAKLLMFRSYFSKKGVCPKSVTKTLYRNKFLVSECIFRLVSHCESCRLSEIGCVLKISLKHLWTELLLLLVMKSSHRSCSQLFPYDRRSVSIVLKPSPFSPKLYLIFQFLIIKNCTNKKSVGNLVKRWTYWWSS